jgi:cell division protein FtsB
VLLWLVVFLLVAVAVQARQSAAIATARRVAALREQRTALEAERAALERQIHLATSRKVLGARAETELGLHQPADSQFFYFRLGGARH